MWTSKLGNRYPKEQIEKTDRAHHQALDRLRKEPSNARCAECGEGGTCWASVNLGVFVCLRCSDVHRALGTHISKVKGCTGTYLWGPDEIERMQAVGNAAAEQEFGGSCPAARPAADASKEERVELCRKKYEQRCWAPKASAQQAPRQPPAIAAPTESAASGRAAAPTRVKQGVARSEAQKQAVDLIDFDAFFRSFEERAAPSAPAAAATAADAAAAPSSLPRLLAAGSEAAGQSKGAAAKAPEARSCPKTLDDFLGDVLSCHPAAASSAPVFATGPVAAKLERSGSGAVWEDFGAW